MSRSWSTGDHEDHEVWHSESDTVVSCSSYGSFGNSTPKGCKQPESVTDDRKEAVEGHSRHTNNFIYCSHFLSAWGDRMWSFGVGLFLVRIAGNTLQLPAIYGLTSGLSIFALGALVGDWIDSTPRLRAAQISLVTQNLLVAMCAGGVYAYIHWESRLTGGQFGWWIMPLGQGMIILLAVLADLTSMARVLAVEKDWIVKICGEDRDLLAKMTATLRRIDQTTLIVAPVATGQVMTYAGLEVGAVFIGAWNLASVGLEYYLMWKVFCTVPALASTHEEETLLMKDKTNKRPTTSNTAESETTLSNPSQTQQPPTTTPSNSSSPSHLSSPHHPSAAQPDERRDIVVKTTPQWNEFNRSHRTDLVGTLVADTEILLEESEDLQSDSGGGGRDDSRGCCGRAMARLSALYEGWRQYKKYTVALAGLALSFLYMTVLGFDNITVAYAVTQGVSESILGIMMAVSAVFGMVGTFIYPIWRRRVGLVRTGMLALSCQVCCLSLCVVSVWMPGSPFDPTYSNVPAPAAQAAKAAATPSSDSTWTPFSQTSRWSTPKGYPSPATHAEATSYSPTAAAMMPPSLETSSQPRWTTPLKISSATQMSTFLGTKTSSPFDASKHFSSSSNSGVSSITSTVTANLNISLTSKSMWSVTGNITLGTMGASSHTRPSSGIENFTTAAGSQKEGDTTTTIADQMGNSSSASNTTGSSSEGSGKSGSLSYVSVTLFITGIVLARFGLWTADLAITQQFLEVVKEGERGAVNGVQNSLNQFFDVLKFLLVILIPDTQTFGFLILLSFAFICASWVLYAVFLKRVRGHFCHRWKCCGGDDAEYSEL